MADGRPIPPKASSREHPFSSSWTGGGSWIGTPRAEDIVARDLAELSEDDDAMDNVIDSDTDLSADEGPTLYRRPSGVAYGTSRPVMNPQTNPESTPFLTRVEKKQSRDAERSLLRDNHVLPPKRPRGPGEPFYRRTYRRLFSTKVVEIVAAVLPICAAMMVFDGLSTGAHGLLRGIGRPSVGGYAGISVYYLIALPVSLGTAFGLGWKLSGLWFGVTIGLLLVSVIEYTFVYLTDWHKAAREAERRNAAG
ncbi:hypothetical protein VdG1_05906 [Verticillium dahliae VDG1]|nr:hypothetical protein VdG1_05906 [Verticillium dahliae VDG1]